MLNYLKLYNCHIPQRAIGSKTSILARSIERISELPKQKQRFVMEMLETVLAQANA